MKAIVITRFGGPEVLELKDVPQPVPAEGEVLVQVQAAGVNFADIMTAQRSYPGTPPAPLVAGREFAGTIVGTGERVMGYAQWGAFAEFIAAPRQLLWPQPMGWSPEEAAAFPVNYFTAYLAYWKASLLDEATSDVRPRVLIHAAAGGVGTAAIEIGKILNLEMYGTSSSEEKLAKVKELGLQHGINYKQDDYEHAIKELTNGEGVDAVFEMLGGEHTAKSLRCLRDFGRVILYGTATGTQPKLDVRALYAKSASVQGLWLTYLSQKPEIMGPAWQQLSAWIQERKLTPQIGKVFPFDRAVEAYKLLEQGKNYGKVILKIAA